LAIAYEMNMSSERDAASGRAATLATEAYTRLRREIIAAGISVASRWHRSTRRSWTNWSAPASGSTTHFELSATLVRRHLFAAGTQLQ
jgi:hypothetical protein